MVVLAVSSRAPHGHADKPHLIAALPICSPYSDVNGQVLRGADRKLRRIPRGRKLGRSHWETHPKKIEAPSISVPALAGAQGVSSSSNTQCERSDWPGAVADESYFVFGRCLNNSQSDQGQELVPHAAGKWPNCGDLVFE